MADVRACRGCLTVKGKLEKIGDASKRQYTAVTGLMISDSDKLPHYFCVECRHHIRKSLAFRRRTRRAHFVMQEIMSIRHQISYNDIVTVNRKRTNLESSLDISELNNSACFLLTQEAEDTLQKYRLQDQQYVKSQSFHIVDIEPEVIETPNKPETPVKSNETHVTNNDTFNNDVTNDNTWDNDDIPSNNDLELEADKIDMNDVFKDLNDEVSEDENQEDDDNLNDDDDDDTTRSKFPVFMLAKSLTLFNIKVLTLEQQKEKMDLRRNAVAFKRARYKCFMCLTVHKTMKELVKHSEYHKNKSKFEHECQACRNKFPTPESLDLHISNCHLYEYQCRICRTKALSQADAYQHTHKHTPKVIRKHSDNEDKRKGLRQVLQHFTVERLSHKTSTTKEVQKTATTKEVQKPSTTKEVQKPSTTKEVQKTATTKEPIPGEKPFQCDICGISVTNLRILEKHITGRHRYQYTCHDCEVVCTTREQAIKHNETHSRIYYCKDCDTVFDRLKSYRTHCKSRHVPRVPCNLCGVSATERTLYRHQLRQHGRISVNDPLIGDPQYKCMECSVQFVDQSSLNTHLVDTNHEGADDVKFACVPCKKQYANEDELEAHFITCGHSYKFPRKCCYCSERLYDKYEYKRHYLSYHPRLPYRYISKNSICDICGISVFQPLLDAHLRTHGGAIPCRLCDVTHTTPARHVTHMLSYHTRRPYFCSVCSRRFRYRADCKDHILKVHAPTKLYKCDCCGEEFSYFRILKDHCKSLHGLDIPTTKAGLTLLSRDTIYVFTHMRIEINTMEEQYVKQVPIELVDYLEQKSKPVKYSDYFIFTPDPDEVAKRCAQKRIRIRMKNPKVKKIKIKRELKRFAPVPLEVKQEAQSVEIEIKNEVNDSVKIVNVKEEYSEMMQDSEVIGEANEMIEESGVMIGASMEIIEQDEVIRDASEFIGESMEIIEQDSQTMGEGSEMIEMASEMMGEGSKMIGGVKEMIEGKTKSEGAMKSDGITMDTMQLQVIESDGNQYVMIDGQIYRIACGDELEG